MEKQFFANLDIRAKDIKKHDHAQQPEEIQNPVYKIYNRKMLNLLLK